MSWMIVNKVTGEVITEIFNQEIIDLVNKEKYKAIPAKEYLASLSKTRYNWLTGQSEIISEES